MAKAEINATEKSYINPSKFIQKIASCASPFKSPHKCLGLKRLCASDDAVVNCLQTESTKTGVKQDTTSYAVRKQLHPVW